MLKIRLRRVGAKGQPMYRVVVAESESPRDGRFVEIIGSYNPLTNPATIVMKEDRLNYWRSVGAQTTESVDRLLRSAKIGVEQPATPANG
ncbi:MAG: 30S ribosomal protein S16 [Anaerolineae bacterium]